MTQLQLTFLTVSHSHYRTGKNVTFCLQRYKCNVEMVFSDQMNNIIESHFIRSTDCMHASLANLLFEIIMVRDGLLSFTTWFS